MRKYTLRRITIWNITGSSPSFCW